MDKQQIVFLKKLVISCFIFILLLSFSMINLNSNTLTIATKNLTEQRIVAYMLEEVIERDTDINVEIKSGMDATSFIHNAIIHNDIDMYIEYSSVSFIEIMGQQYTGQSRLEILDYIKKEYPSQYNLEWISTLGFDNSNAIICSGFCKENNITTYSELAKYDFSFGAPAYFYERSDGYNLLEDTYGFSNNVTKKKIDPILTYVAVSSGDIDAGLAFTTDAKLKNDDYIILEDDLNAFPVYDAGIIISDKSLNKFPELKPILAKFNNILSNKIIREANLEVETTQKSTQDVAHELVNKLDL